MAGGTDLMVKIRHRALFPKQIISLKKIDGLDAITFDEKSGLTIGATALLADVASDPMIREHYPTVAEAAESTANVQVRNMGTVVGNLCNASPSADNAPTLIALGATVNITGPSGTRIAGRPGQDRARHRGVERGHLAAHGDARHEVDALAHAGIEAAALRAGDDDDGSAQVDLANGQAGVAVGADDSHAAGVQIDQAGGQVG